MDGSVLEPSGRRSFFYLFPLFLCASIINGGDTFGKCRSAYFGYITANGNGGKCIAIGKSVVSYLDKRVGEGQFREFTAPHKRRVSDMGHVFGNIYSAQIIASAKCTVADLIKSIGKRYLGKFFTTVKSIRSNIGHSLWDIYRDEFCALGKSA